MPTQYTLAQLRFLALGRRDVIGRFDCGRITSDGVGVLLRKGDVRLGLLDRLARRFSNCRNPNSGEHSVCLLLGQRICALALGYEDLSDHEELRGDSLLGLLVGKADLKVTGRVRLPSLAKPLQQE